MGLTPGTPIREIFLDKVFIGSCTNSRIEDLRAAAVVAKGKRIAKNIKLAMVVPGSGLVKSQASRKVWTRYSKRQVSNGANPAARCVWHECRPAGAG